MTSTSRFGHALLVTVGLLVAGCFDPRIENGAFVCEPRDDPPCPTGFYCFNNECIGNGADVAATVAQDLGADAAVAMDLAAGSGDLAHAPPDLTLPPPDLASPRDLAPPPDLATGVCGHAGAPCTSIQDCCSQYCRTDGICIGG